MNADTRCVSLVALAALAVAGCASSGKPYEPRPASPTSGQTAQRTETVEVVGSRLKRTVDPDNPNATTLSPVSVVTKEQMEEKGYTSVFDAVAPMINMRGR